MNNVGIIDTACHTNSNDLVEKQLALLYMTFPFSDH